MTTDKTTLKSWFRKGLKPLEAHFAAWIDSYWHKAEQIPTSSIEGLEATLNSKAETSETQTIKQTVANIIDGTTPVEKARYAEKLGTEADHYTKTTLDSRLATFQTKTGDGKNITVTFSQADKRENIASGENLYGLFGKIARWFSDLKAVAFSGNTSDLAETGGKLFFTQAERNKLTGIADGANAYIHPASHPATMITEDTTHRFVTDSEKTTWNNKADLDGSGKIPASQLPSYVDDVLTYPALSGFPSPGENGKIYIAADTNRQYRWSGSAYVEISASLALGETAATAYRGDRGKIAYDYATTQRTIGEIKDLQTTLNGKSDNTHTHPISKIDGLQTELNKKVNTDQIPTNFDNLYVPKTGGTYTGYVDFIAGAGNSGSDMRFKTDVAPLENILDDLLDLQIISYTWTKEGETRRNTFGLSATQLTEKGGTFQKIVHERGDDDHTQWVEYDRIGILALKGLQETVAELRNANQRLETQQHDIDTFKQQIAALQRQMQTLSNPKTQE